MVTKKTINNFKNHIPIPCIPYCLLCFFFAYLAIPVLQTTRHASLLMDCAKMTITLAKKGIMTLSCAVSLHYYLMSIMFNCFTLVRNNALLQYICLFTAGGVVEFFTELHQQQFYISSYILMIEIVLY